MGRVAKIARRTFLIGSVAVTGGVAFGVYKFVEGAPNPLESSEGNVSLNAFVVITEDGVTLEQIEERAKQAEIDEFLQPLEIGLDDLPRVHCPEASIAKLRNGNPALVMGDVEYGDECWAAHGDHAIAVGVFKGGELHPTRVFVGQR